MNIKARIKAIGDPTGKVDKRKSPICKVRCQGCGEEIRSDQGLSDVEYVKTKRGSEWFFHTGCMNQIWNRKIV